MDYTYIPKETILHLIDDMDIDDVISFFTTNKEVRNLADDPEVLRHISLRFNLPFVSSFANLVYLVDHWEQTFISAIDLEDDRVLQYFYNNLDLNLGYIIVYAANIGRLDIADRLLYKEGYTIPSDAIVYNTTIENLSNNEEEWQTLEELLIYATLESGAEEAIAMAAAKLGLEDVFDKYAWKGDNRFIGEKLMNTAARYGNADIVESIYETEVSPYNAFEEAIKNDHANVVSTLLRMTKRYNGARESVREAKNALKLAEKYGKDDIIGRLNWWINYYKSYNH